MVKKFLNVFTSVLSVLLVLFAMFTVFLVVFIKKDTDGTKEIFGYQMRIVLSESMEKSSQTDVSQYKIKDIKKKSLIFVKVKPNGEQAELDWYANLKVGDVLTFKYIYFKQEIITHRIIDIKPNLENTGYIIKLQGDNKQNGTFLSVQEIDTAKTDENTKIIGIVKGQNYTCGVILSVLSSKPGIVCIIIIPSIILLCVEVIKIIKSKKKGVT